ncbi:MAG: hypothetical protein D6732_28290 [Methanobacteriota archaeon]|nr:MAG: hypothetical protein D6732_28290 [Euryarchaeota archaeon]
MKNKSQLFVIEVLVAIGVILILLTTLFSAQNFSEPIKDDPSSDLKYLENAVRELRESGILFEYFDAARQAFLSGSPLSSSSTVEQKLVQALKASLPSNFEFLVNLYHDINNNGTYTLIDLANQNSPQSPDSDILVYEYYSAAHNSMNAGPVYERYRFQLTAWKL